MDTKNINTTALAYIGDAVYEVYIREYVMKYAAAHADRLHREAVRYVSAAGQAKAIKKMFDSLDEEEQQLVKRARNHKYSSKARSASPMDYKWATACEALIGRVHLDGNIAREKQLVAQIIEIIDSEEI